MLRRDMFAEQRDERGLVACAYCGDLHALEGITLDHVIPISKGGLHNRGNALLVCLVCNNTKDSLSAWAFKRWLLSARGVAWVKEGPTRKVVSLRAVARAEGRKPK